MNVQVKNKKLEKKINTDKAWDNLYARLKEDRLIPVEQNRIVRNPVVSRLAWAAAIAVLCILGGISFYRLNSGPSEKLLSLENTESNTLVSTLEDGSIVYLTAGATLVYPEHFDPGKRVVSLKGEAMFDVIGNKARPFVIETESTRIEVVGTAFRIRSSGKESFELSVQQGIVKTTLKTSSEETLARAGETLQLEAGQLVKSISVPDSQFNQFTEKMRFKDDRLDNIVRVISKISERPIVFADTTLAGQKMTVTFSNDSPEYMIELLCMALNLRHFEVGDTILIKD